MTTLPNAPCFMFYNGVTWPTETETVGVSVKPLPDGSGRAVKNVLYEITLRAILGQANQSQSPGVGGPASTDSTMAELRKRLTAYGGELHYNNVGLGNLAVNVPPGGPTPGGIASRVRDVAWGPKPRILTWKPLGQVAADVTWTVEVAIPECDVAAYAFALMEFVFKVGLDIDRSGYTRARTYTGYIRIPQTRRSVHDGGLSDQADAYREKINPPLVPGFRRTPGRFALSEDRCRLDFEIVDEEMPPNYPPPGIIDVTASQTTSTSKALAGQQWTTTLNATYEVARDAPRGLPFKHFMQLLADRTKIIGRGKNRFTLVQALTLSEPEIYGRKSAAFSATCRVLTTLKDIIKDSGLWKPVPDNSWQKWSTSLAKTAFHLRGNAKIAFTTSVDAIIDLCSSGGYDLRTGGINERQLTAQGEFNFKQQAPPPSDSWIAYSNAVVFEPGDETYELKTLPASTYGLSTEVPPATKAGGYTLSTAPASTSTSSSSSPGAPTVQVRAETSRYVFLRGAAVRAGYPVDVPRLTTFGGVGVIPANRLDRGEGVLHWEMTAWFGVPIYAARWNLRYLVQGRPKFTTPPPQPYVLE